LLNGEEERALAARIKAGDPAAREALTVANLRLVVCIARHYRPVGGSLDDLIQEGTRGLMKAVENYDPEAHDVRFSTYASYWIRNAIQRSLAASCSLLRLPDYMFRLRSRLNRAMTELQALPAEGAAAETAPPADDEAVARHMNISRDQLAMVQRAFTEQSPYYTENAEGREVSLEQEIADRSHPELDHDRAEEISELHAALDRLTPFEAWLIRRRFDLADASQLFGIAGRDGEVEIDPSAEGEGIELSTKRSRSYNAIGRACGLSGQRVRDLEQLALRKLRADLAGRLSLAS
jgi:RNA polymerase primary sigma factor